MGDFSQYVDLPEVMYMLHMLPTDFMYDVDVLGLHYEKVKRGTYKRAEWYSFPQAVVDETQEFLKSRAGPGISDPLWRVCYHFKKIVDEDKDAIADACNFMEMYNDNKQHENSTIFRLIKHVAGGHVLMLYTPYLEVLRTGRLEKHVYSFAARRWYVLELSELDTALSLACWGSD
jgi:hypothetical protein